MKSFEFISFWYAVGLVIVLISGCGEYKVAEFKSRDGQIRFVAVTPFECDESKPIEADVVGLPYKPARLHIRFVNCDYRFQVDELDAVEGQDWFALIAPRLLRPRRRIRIG